MLNPLNHGLIQIDFYLPPQFENFDGHRDPDFHTDQSDNGLHKRCEASFYIFCNFENMGL